jgi:acyl transferase domain-containing protein/acyl-CoA synthetase (AMP-forming)/AMP-acid ligase II/acyl carrier protein
VLPTNAPSARSRLAANIAVDPSDISQLPACLPEALRQAARRDPAATIVHVDAGGHEKRQTLSDLLTEAAAVCGGLAGLGLKPGDSAILLLERSGELLPAFWGSVLAGVRPVVAQIPPTFAGEGRSLQQLGDVWRLLDRPLVICNADLIDSVRLPSSHPGTDKVRCANVAALMSAPRAGEFHQPAADETAFFSLTSGSTGTPKCIGLTHANILRRAHGANLLCGHSPRDVILNWLPFNHIGSISDWHLRCVLLGCTMVYAPKESVLANPLHWFELIDKYRVTHTWAPNFAYSLVSSTLAARREKREPSPRWDLSCVEGMLSAGEPVAPQVIRQFLEELAPFGLKSTAIRPAFGMAELGSGITYHVETPDHPLRFHSTPRLSPQAEAGTSQADSAPAESVAADSFAAATLTGLGPPIPGVGIRIVNDDNEVVPENTLGHLQVSGAVVSPGYFRNPEANRVFRDDGWFETGDMGFLVDGELVVAGRAKESIIVRGVNYSCGEIEQVVNSVAGVEPGFTAACAVRRAGVDREELALFFHTPADDDRRLAEILREIQQSLVRKIGLQTDFLLPVSKDAIPKTAIGKVQRGELSRRFAEGEFAGILEHIARLPVERVATKAHQLQLPQSEIERRVAAILQEAFGGQPIGVQDNLFDLGGDSLLLTQIHGRLQSQFGPRLTLVDMFKYPTIQSLARFLGGDAGSDAGPNGSARARRRRRPAARRDSTPGENDVAVIGMSCRFPGAANIRQFWRNLCDGIESMQFFSDEELLHAGIDPRLLDHPDYVKVSSVLPDIEWFDARFFGITPRDAALMDPQQRILLECAWETFEVAGYNPLAYRGTVGVYAGAGMNTYLLNNLYPARSYQSPDDNSEILTLDSMEGFRVMVANDKDYLPTRISYKLNLRGPSVNVQTACSTTLVAVHMAAQAVRYGECDMALAGGVSIKVPQEAGYLYLEDMIVSPDGHCRAFDARAQGTVFGNGAGLVLLKRLDEAIADGDHIFAVIKGSAINNDGSGKVGYMAPSQEGMAAVVSEALDRSGVDPRTIGFVEAHGTGTALGDPIELGAITEGFRSGTADSGYCAVGSVKTNVGHLQIASGVAGFIKTSLALYHKQIPPTLHFETPNPRIDFANSPFYVNDRLLEWSSNESPLRASVNSLGIGGTNAHIVLEEAPRHEQPSESQRSLHFLPISARTPGALRKLLARYREALEQLDDAALADFCYTAAIGRAHFAQRFAAAGATVAELQRALNRALLPAGNGNADHSPRNNDQTRVGFLFAGLGAKPAGVSRKLYESQPHFRAAVDRCAKLLANDLPRPLLELLLTPEADSSLGTQPETAELAHFVAEYALAEMWRKLGVEPAVVLGQGVGEYAAATIAGVFTLEDCLKLVVARARWQGGKTSAFRKVLDRLVLSPPRIPFLSSATGRSADDELTTSDYWCRQLGEKDRLAEHLPALADLCDRFLEPGPRETLLTAARQRLGGDSRFQADECWLSTLREGAGEGKQILNTLSALYIAGLEIDWESFYHQADRRRVVLPTYPFERKRFWVDRPRTRTSAVTSKGPIREGPPRGRSKVSESSPEDNSILDRDQRDDDAPGFDDEG